MKKVKKKDFMVEKILQLKYRFLFEIFNLKNVIRNKKTLFPVFVII